MLPQDALPPTAPRHAGTPARRVAGSPDAEVTTRIDHHGLSYYVQYEPDSDLTIPGADIDIEDTYEVRTIGIDQDDSKQPALRGAMLDSAYYENQATMSR